MTELEKIAYAKKFIDQLANGINPLDGTHIPDEEVLNQVRVARCLFYVSGLLQQLMDQTAAPNVRDAYKGKGHRKAEFALTQEARMQLSLSEKPLLIRDITERLNSLVDQNIVKRISAAAIHRWLVAEGILEEIEIDGKNRKHPTQAGDSIGIYTEQREGQYGIYTVLLYSADAQELIYDNIDAIIAYDIAQKNTKQNSLEDMTDGFRGTPWTEEQEVQLIRLFQEGANLKSMAATMQRTQNGIRARLVRLGLIEHRHDI